MSDEEDVPKDKTPPPADPRQRSLQFTPATGQAAPSDTVFSNGFRREMGKQVLPRAEIAATIVLDGALLAVSLAVRAALLWVVHYLSPGASGGPEEPIRDWAVRVVEFVLNFGLVGTVVLVTGFDLLKRIRVGYRAFRAE